MYWHAVQRCAVRSKPIGLQRQGNTLQTGALASMRLVGLKQVQRDGLAGHVIDVESSAIGTAARLFAFLGDEHASDVSSREDAFVPALVMAALVAREDLDLGGIRADPLLVRGALAAARQHAQWWERFRVPEISGWQSARADLRPAARAIAFFSGGLDSQFTLLRHVAANKAEPTRSTSADIVAAPHLFHTDNVDKIERGSPAEMQLSDAVLRLGSQLLPIYSNIMVWHPDWHHYYGPVTHGAGLASLARAFGANIDTCLIASSDAFGNLSPWGSSPLVDPLFSARDLQVVHDGSMFTRVEKTEYISRYPDTLRSLNVCDQIVIGRGYVNCSRCQKCLRTMTALDLCGMRGKAAAFDWSDYKPTSFGEIFLKPYESVYAVELIAAAEARGRYEIARSIKSSLRRSRLFGAFSGIEEALRHSRSARRAAPWLRKLRLTAARAVGLRR